MTLGELIIEERGKITGQRFLDVKISKVDTSLILEGNCRGTPFIEVRTVISVREGDALYGEGQGIITTKDDKERANWTAQGIGKVRIIKEIVLIRVNMNLKCKKSSNLSR
jgi:hypothetical protein